MAGESTLELVTGYRGKAHVTADDARALNAGIVGSGTYVLPEGKGLAAEMIDSNTLRVQSGTLLIQGCQCRVRAGESVDVKIRNGSQAMKRNDIVVARWEKQAAEPRTESVELKVIEGTPSSKAAEDPAHTEGDLSSDLVAEFPLWRIPLDGIAVGTPVPLYKKLVSVDALGDSVSQTVAKVDKLASDLDEHSYVADYIYGKNAGHTIGFSWKDNKLGVYIDGILVRTW